jgi:hypothetical protein
MMPIEVDMIATLELLLAEGKGRLEFRISQAESGVNTVELTRMGERVASEESHSLSTAIFRVAQSKSVGLLYPGLRNHEVFRRGHSYREGGLNGRPRT